MDVVVCILVETVGSGDHLEVLVHGEPALPFKVDLKFVIQ